MGELFDHLWVGSNNAANVVPWSIPNHMLVVTCASNTN